MIAHLDRGQCIVRQSLSGFKDPMLVQVDFVPPYRGPRPPADTHPFIPSQPLSEMPELVEALKRLAAEQLCQKKSKAGVDKEILSGDAHKMLNLMSVHAFWPLYSIFSRMPGKMSVAKRAAVVDELMKVKLIEVSVVRIGSTKRELGALTTKGCERLGIAEPGNGGRGGCVHRHFCAWIQAVGLHRGCDKALNEWTIPGTNHPVDVVHINGESHEIWEVVVECSSNLVASLRAALTAESIKVSSVNVVAATRDRLEELKQTLRAEGSDLLSDRRLRFQDINPYLKEFMSHASGQDCPPTHRSVLYHDVDAAEPV